MANRRWKLLAGMAVLVFAASACGSAATPSPEEATDAPAESATAPAATTAAPSGEQPTIAVTSPTSGTSAKTSALPKGPVTIATFGDSLTQGDCDESGRGYPGRLLPLVEKIRPGSKVVNVGHSGWTSGDLANTANDAGTDIAKAIDAAPNIALVWIGSNDLWALYEFGPEPMTVDAEREDLATYEANLDTLLTRLSGKGASVYIALLDDQSKRPVVANPPNPAELAFPATTKADLARMSAHVTAMNDIIRRKASARGGTTVDFFDTSIFTDPHTLCGDGNHPNESGYDAIAGIWYAALEPALR